MSGALLTAIIFAEDGGFTGFIEEFVHISAHGRTPKEVRAALKSQAEMWIASNREGMMLRQRDYASVRREKIIVNIDR